MFIRVDEVRLHYAQDGQGTDLILIHGLGGNLRDWDAYAPHLARHHRVLRWDVRGFGDSEKPAGPYSVQPGRGQKAGQNRDRPVFCPRPGWLGACLQPHARACGRHFYGRSNRSAFCPRLP